MVSRFQEIGDHLALNLSHLKYQIRGSYHHRHTNLIADSNQPGSVGSPPVHHPRDQDPPCALLRLDRRPHYRLRVPLPRQRVLRLHHSKFPTIGRLHLRLDQLDNLHSLLVLVNLDGDVRQLRHKFFLRNSVVGFHDVLDMWRPQQLI